MKKIIKNDYFYGKKENRNNLIKEFSLNNLDKKIMIIDLEKDIQGLYSLTNLNSIKTILLNTEVNNILYYLDLLDEVDTIIINGIQNIENLTQEHKEALREEIEGLKRNKELFTIFLGKDENKDFEKRIKIKKVKLKKEIKEIFKINKDLDLNDEDIYFEKRRRVKMIGDKTI